MIGLIVKLFYSVLAQVILAIEIAIAAFGCFAMTKNIEYQASIHCSPFTNNEYPLLSISH
jgi:hypothetical protein